MDFIAFSIGLLSIAISLLTAIAAVYIQRTYKVESVGWKAVAFSCLLLAIRRIFAFAAQAGIFPNELDATLDWLLSMLVSAALLYGLWRIHKKAQERYLAEREAFERVATVERNLQMRLKKCRQRRK